MELIEYWHLLCRRKWVILVALILSGGLGAAWVYYASPQYEARGKLLFTEDDGLGGSLGLGGSSGMLLSAIGRKSDPLTTQLEMIQTRPVLQETIEKCSLQTDSGALLRPADLREQLSLSVVTNTNIIQLSCRNSAPDRAAAILDTLMAVYIRHNRRLNRESARSARVFIEEQLTEQKQKLDSAEARLVRYKNEIGIVSLEAETQVKITSLAELRTELMQIETVLRGLQAEKNNVEAKLGQSGARNSSLYSIWRSRLEEVNTQIANARARRRGLGEAVRDKGIDLNSIPEKEIEYANLMRDREIAQNIYEKLLENYDRLRIQEASSVSSARVIEPAESGAHPVAPNKKKLLALALIAGGMLGFGIALLQEYLDDTPHSVDEVEKLLDTSVLCTIPYQKKLPSDFIRSENQSLPAEALRIAHTNLKFSPHLRAEGNALLVTSSQPGEGKSTLSVNLGMVYAEMGARTCVVNLDMRRPSFHTVVDRKFGAGMTDYLIGEATREEISYTDCFENLTIIPAGSVPPNPTVLIASKGLLDFIDELRRDFDMLIIDTPPVTMVSETLEVARHVNGIIEVVDLSAASKRRVQSMGRIFAQKDLPLLGIIINKAGKNGSRYQYDFAEYLAES